MVSIHKKFGLGGIFYLLGPGVRIGEDAAEARTSIQNKPENHKRTMSGEPTFEEPLCAVGQTSAMHLGTICMMRCLKDIDYARKKLKNLELKNKGEYVEHIDSFKMLFSRKEIADFTKSFASTLDVFLKWWKSNSRVFHF
jgi:hypothetical protein